MNVNEYHAIRTRRSFLDKSLYGLGLGVLSHLLGIEGRTAPTNSLLQQEPHFKPRAKNIIFLFQAGAPSQIDLFDPKPELHKWNGSPLPDSLARNLDLAFIQPTAKVLASRRKFHPAGNSALNFQSPGIKSSGYVFECTNMSNKRKLVNQSMRIGLIMFAGMVSLDSATADKYKVRVERLLDAPIISPEFHPGIGENIQGPSLVKVPDWVENPLGSYYIYFADHKGSYIRLAYADELSGPWTVYPQGSLQITDTHFPSEPPLIPAGELEKVAASRAVSAGGHNKLPHSLAMELTAPHIASPDVHVNNEKRQIVMYFHGLDGFNSQVTRVALSKDGIRFKGLPEILGKSYFRVFMHHGTTYALVMPGRVYRSKDGLTGFEEGPLLFNPKMRHSALLKRGDLMYVFWTQVGDAPERILLSTIDLSHPWTQWQDSSPQEVLRPEKSWEGSGEPLKPSLRSVAYGRVNQLRDPAIYEEGNRVYLLYAVAGESGIAIAEVHLDD